MTGIDWDDMLDGNFVKIESDVPKDMLITNWKPQTTFKDDDNNIRKGLVFDVDVEDGKTLTPPKTWTVTSVRCLKALKPFLEGKKSTAKVGVKVTRTGSGKATMYAVAEQ